MLDNQGFRDRDRMSLQITEGTPVLDANGDKVGEVATDGVQSTALIVKKGLLFTKEVYVPLSLISGTDADGVHLTLQKSEISHQNWEMPPAQDPQADYLADSPVDNPMRGGVVGTGLNDMAPGADYGARPQQQRDMEGYMGSDLPEEDQGRLP